MTERKFVYAVIGSRTFEDYTMLKNALGYRKVSMERIVTGGAIGADALAMRFARDNGIELRVYYPDYAKYNRDAPLRRNHDIVDACDWLIAFWDGESRGTKYTINLAEKAGKKVEIYRF